MENVLLLDLGNNQLFNSNEGSSITNTNVTPKRITPDYTISYINYRHNTNYTFQERTKHNVVGTNYLVQFLHSANIE